MAVKTYLVSHFPRIKSGNLTVAGYGRSRPVASNETDAGRKQNRRVEFKVVGGAD
jgi:OOP family OmpA-OmpF porin